MLLPQQHCYSQPGVLLRYRFVTLVQKASRPDQKALHLKPQCASMVLWNESGLAGLACDDALQTPAVAVMAE